MMVLRRWQEPRPAVGEFAVDVQFWDGECITIHHKSERSANRHAERTCQTILNHPMHPCGVRSVAMYRGREVSR